MAETSSFSVTKECRMKGNGYCPKPLEQAAAFLTRKWTLSIIVTIGNFGTLRFNDLLRRMDGVTQKILSERLKELERYNLVFRQGFPEKPPRVEYSLTLNGHKIRRSVLPLLKLAESQTFYRNV